LLGAIRFVYLCQTKVLCAECQTKYLLRQRNFLGLCLSIPYDYKRCVWRVSQWR